jgi:hypothetical protein
MDCGSLSGHFPCTKLQELEIGEALEDSCCLFELFFNAKQLGSFSEVVLSDAVEEGWHWRGQIAGLWDGRLQYRVVLL